MKRIAVIKLRGLGDTVLWAPALRELRKLYPQAEIGALCPAPWRDLVALFPGVSQAWGLEGRSFWGMVRTLRAFKPDMVLAFHATPRTALAAYLSGASVRVVRNHSGRDWFSTVEVTAKKEAKAAQLRDLDLVEALVQDRPKREPLIKEGYLALPAALMERARRTVPGWGQKAPLVFCPGSSKRTGEWPVERWIELARALGEKGIVPVLSTGPGEGHWNRAFEQAGVIFHRLENPDLPLLAGVLAQSRLCVAAESGPKHLAAALGCPTITIWGSSLFKEWHPYDQDRHPAILAPVPCRPCFRNSCDHLSCLRGIETEEVKFAVLRELEAKGSHKPSAISSMP